MTIPNSRIDIRISNPEKEQWQEHADKVGLTLTQLIKQAVRQKVADANANISVHYPPAA